MASKKSCLNVVTIGPKTGGKSTLVGQMLYKFGVVDDPTLKRITEEATALDNYDSRFAYLVDRTPDERRRKCTIEPTLCSIQSDSRVYSILDSPGHPGYVRHLLSAVSQADCAILVVSSMIEDYELEREQLKEHAVLAYTFGVTKIVICINKMDQIKYSEKKFEELKKRTIQDVAKIGYKDKKIVVIPVCALQGDNILEPSTRMFWYSGPTLYEVLENFKVPKRKLESPLRMVVHKVHVIPREEKKKPGLEPSRHFFKDIQGEGQLVAVGRIEFGSLSVNQKVKIQPGDLTAKIHSIEFHRESIEKATAGMIVGVCVSSDSFASQLAKGDIQKGSVISCVGANEAKECRAFKGQIILLNGPKEFGAGYRPIICAHGLYKSCIVSKLFTRFDKHNRNTLEQNPEFAGREDGVVCEFRCEPHAMVIEPYEKFPALGRLVLRDNGRVIGVGLTKPV